MRSLLVAFLTLCAGAALADEPAGQKDGAAAAVAASPMLLLAAPVGCANWKAPGLQEGPLPFGYLEADMAVGRRVCGRTEVAVGANFGAIIDTPNFYGNLGATGLLSGSFALREDLELFGTLEAVDFTYTQNAALKTAQLALGNLTVGATRRLYQRDAFVGAISARLLLPTTFQIPGSRPLGLELGHASSWRPGSSVEVHTWLGADATAGLGAGPAFPRLGGTVLAGFQWSPLDWFGVVIDVTGRYGRMLGVVGANDTVSYLAPTVGLRFRMGTAGLEVGGSLPLVGTDRHDLIAGLKLAWRL